MVKATQGVTYINGVTSSLNDKDPIYIESSTLVLGNHSTTREGNWYPSGVRPGLFYIDGTPTVFADYQRIANVDLALGQTETVTYIGSKSDRAPNLPSGYSNIGAATFGSGKMNKTTTWAQDRSILDASGVFMLQEGQSSFDYSNLT